ncbi:DUF1553 domain-containing protein [Planctellipticum variicoloris]|uniref:DUF1553 domain-containing protein n=1 Tax=Planctellipticum variicoloris TaxID=3064265 RepID=UPI003013CBB2|nr:DUF1553 domain-containing protein [Planctomycetaceae bacterium SH412]
MLRLVGMLAVVLLSSSGRAFAADPLDYNRDIKPILSNNCFQCHGPDAAERKGGTDGLRLDTAEGATADQGGSFAIVPRHPEQSALVARVLSRDPDEVMPPAATGKKLTEREKELLERWVREGGAYATHWSYAAPVRPAIPAVKNAKWPRNDIDRFLLARLEREGLQPMPEADKATLIRRVSLDLTGLPPTIAEVDAFLQDESQNAYEKLVDRLLEKPAYGEHWAHQWLDLARYADSAGYADDPPRTIWLYRDYVIKAFNENKPFDQFTVEQIAGDLLPSPTNDQLIATAFHRNTLTNSEGGTNDEEFRNVAIVDRVNTTMAVWMGTTIACAQCHSHKYDPLSQEEFFKLFAFFNHSEDADRRDESPLLSIFTPEQQQQRQAWEAEIAGLQQTLQTLTPELAIEQQKWMERLSAEFTWIGLIPSQAKRESGKPIEINSDAVVSASEKADTDVYRLELPALEGTLRALKLETASNSGLAGGNFVLTGVKVNLVPPGGTAAIGRYVRVELPGKQRILHLAEVQAFRGDENLALKGQASQSSTDFGGDAGRGIDGNTDGDYAKNSVTHCAITDDPWWEVDLKADQPLERIVIWNRTDGDTESRIKGFKVSVLNAARETIWQQMVDEIPNPQQALSVSGVREVAFTSAIADYMQPGFNAQEVLKNDKPAEKGWAVGGAIDAPHVLTLLTSTPVSVPAGATLQVTLEQQSKHAGHLLGSFRLSVTDDERAGERAATPAAVLHAITARSEADRTAEERAAITKQFLAVTPALATQRSRVAELQKSLNDMPPVTVPIMRDLPADKHRVTKLQHRGNFMDLGQEVSEGTPAVFPSPPAGEPLNRLALAKWLVTEQNPLTARVIANRYWESIFGTGIVATSEEFGSQGDQPSHPELLDWLATELHAMHWDLKAFVKQIVTSAAYRQSSRVTPELVQLDPDNRLLARGPRFRMSAEMIRDQALAVSGLLSHKLYGPPVKPPQPSLGLSAAFGSGIDWQTSGGEDKYRRGLYTTWRRSSPYPSMATFDAPNRETCTLRRVRTNTPLQALVTLNDPVYIEASQALARLALAEGGATTEERMRFAFRRCTSREPHPAELARLVRLHDETAAGFRDHPDLAMKMATEPLGPSPAGVDVVDLAAWSVVGNVLLNLDEMLMKR